MRGTPADRKWMILAPAHYELPVYAWQMEAIAFFDHVLHGAENGYREQPAVRYWLEGADRYAGAADFPVPDSRPLRLYPATSDAASGVLEATAPASSEASWVAVPPGAVLIGGFDEVANQTVTFDFPVDRPLHLAGPVSLSLRLSSNEIDTQVVARLSRIATDGSAHLLSLGTIAAARRARDPAAAPPARSPSTARRRSPSPPVCR